MVARCHHDPGLYTPDIVLSSPPAKNFPWPTAHTPQCGEAEARGSRVGTPNAQPAGQSKASQPPIRCCMACLYLRPFFFFAPCSPPPMVSRTRSTCFVASLTFSSISLSCCLVHVNSIVSNWPALFLVFNRKLYFGVCMAPVALEWTSYPRRQSASTKLGRSTPV